MVIGIMSLPAQTTEGMKYMGFKGLDPFKDDNRKYSEITSFYEQYF